MKTISRTVQFLLFALPAVGLTAYANGEKDKEEKKDAPAQPASEVSGKITLADGEPLPAGMITFHGRDARETVRVTVDQGKYVARNVPAGRNVRVTIEVEPINALTGSVTQELHRAEERARLLKIAKVEDEKLMNRIKELKDRLKVLQTAQKRIKGVKIPEGYTIREQTPLKLTVEPGKQTADFALK